MQVMKSMFGVLDSRVEELSSLKKVKKDDVVGNDEFEYFLKLGRYEQSRR